MIQVGIIYTNQNNDLKIYKFQNEVGIDKNYWNKKWWFYSIAQWENLYIGMS